jgi:uncharacterized protein
LNGTVRSVRTETVALATIDGLHLEGDLHVPAATGPGVVIAHPHPRYGGNRRNAVVEALFQAVSDAGCVALRFDFRGVNGSEGRHDGGEAERLDVAAAIELVEPIVDDRPIVVAGYSFGGVVALNVVDPRVNGWLAVAPPLASAAVPLAGADHRPKHLLVPEHDQFTPPATMTGIVEQWQATTTEVVPMADHFLAGCTAAVAQAAVLFVRRFDENG